MSSDSEAHGRRADLPLYPKAFIAATRFQREKDRVFIAMPFQAEHSKTLWKLLKAACDIHELVPRRADTSVYPRAIVADILEEIERAEIVIADLTGLNPNVLYELGIAHVRCDAVLLLCERGQALPFDLASIRCLFYDLSTIEGKEEFTHQLGQTLESLKRPWIPTVFDTPLERTRSVVSDFKRLADLPDEELRGETVWFSGFLSTFAISEEERFEKEEIDYKLALLEEREGLLIVARRGCSVRCIITPPSKYDLVDTRLPWALQRLKTLLRFLESKDPALSNIEWVISPFRQKNFYIIGRICFSEGFKAGVERGYTLTLRQSDPQAIASSTALHRKLFERLRLHTLITYPPNASHSNESEALRAATVRCLKSSLKFCEAASRTTRTTRSSSSRSTVNGSRSQESRRTPKR